MSRRSKNNAKLGLRIATSPMAAHPRRVIGKVATLARRELCFGNRTLSLAERRYVAHATGTRFNADANEYLQPSPTKPRDTHGPGVEQFYSDHAHGMPIAA